MRAAAVLLFGLALAGAGWADSCDSLHAQIDTKIRNSGVEHFTLTVVDAAASAPGKVVATCDRGAKKIVYLREQAASAGVAPSAPVKAVTPASEPRSDAVLTECKDGTVSVGGRCGR